MTNYHNFKTLDQGFAYIADCNLATVSTMAMLKSKSKSEYRRQISISQKMCDLMVVFKVSPEGTRAEHIIGKTTVAEWAKQYEPKQTKP